MFLVSSETTPSPLSSLLRAALACLSGAAWYCLANWSWLFCGLLAWLALGWLAAGPSSLPTLSIPSLKPFLSIPQTGVCSVVYLCGCACRLCCARAAGNLPSPPTADAPPWHATLTSSFSHVQIPSHFRTLTHSQVRHVSLSRCHIGKFLNLHSRTHFLVVIVVLPTGTFTLSRSRTLAFTLSPTHTPAHPCVHSPTHTPPLPLLPPLPPPPFPPSDLIPRLFGGGWEREEGWLLDPLDPACDLRPDQVLASRGPLPPDLSSFAVVAVVVVVVMILIMSLRSCGDSRRFWRVEHGSFVVDGVLCVGSSLCEV